MLPVQYINIYEYFLLPIYIILIFWVTSRIAKKYYHKNYRSIYLYAAVAFKILGSVVFALMSQYFFKEGDTFMYFSAGLDIQKAVVQHPQGLDILFMDASEFGPFYEANFSNSSNYGYIASTANFFTAKFSAFLSIFGLGGYLLTSIFFGLVALSGMWRMFILFTSLFPTLSREWSICFLFLPSLLYWGGGVMKDTVCLAALGWLFTSFYYFFVAERKKWVHILILASTFYVLYNVKVYIAATLLFVLIIWYVVIKISSISNKQVRGLSAGVIIFTLLISFAVFYDDINDFLNDQILNNVVGYVADAKKNYALSSSESALMTNVTEINTSVASIIQNIPPAINNALFRPYIWEGTSINIFIAGLENFVILAFSVFVLLRRFLSIIPRVFRVQIVAVCLTFSLIFAVLIGLTCFNFGTIVRYKLPCIPLYTATLFLLYHNSIKPRKI